MTSLEEKELSKLGSKRRNQTQRKWATDLTTKNGHFFCVTEMPWQTKNWEKILATDQGLVYKNP